MYHDVTFCVFQCVLEIICNVLFCPELVFNGNCGFGIDGLHNVFKEFVCVHNVTNWVNHLNYHRVQLIFVLYIEHFWLPVCFLFLDQVLDINSCLLSFSAAI